MIAFLRNSDPLPLIVGLGSLAAEEILLARLGELAAAAAGDPSLLAAPVRVVVSSNSLRDHLAAALTRRRGRAVAGIAVETLYAVAAGVLGRAGEAPPRGAAALEVVARRFAAGMPALGGALAGLADGFGSAVGSVRDLLDAGFTDAHLPAAAERLAETARRGLAAPPQAARADELLRVAAACARAMPALGVGTLADAYARAAELLRGDPGLLPCRALFVHGFADATGVALDLLEALLARPDALLVLDLPPDPAGEGGAGTAFADRLVRRLAGRPVAELTAAGSTDAAADDATEATEPPPAEIDLASPALAEPSEPPVEPLETPAALPAEIALVEAAGAEAEAREVVLRVRALLEAGARPEGIGLVARDLGPYRLPLERTCRRLGVPFSGRGAAGSPGEEERRLAALADLLARRSRVAADRWLLAARPAGGGGRGLDLRLGLRTLGAARLAEVAALDVAAVLGEEQSLALPVRRGGSARGDDEREEVEEEEPEGRDEGRGGRPDPRLLRRRRLSRPTLERAVAAAGTLAAHLEAWPREAPLADHLRAASKLLRLHLGWRPDEGPGSRAWGALGTLADDLPGEWTITADDFALLLRRALEGQGSPPLGGEGGGVQLLSVTEARGRTWDHLFVLGLNRDRFPRRAPEDPLLPDALRGALVAVLPDLPLKGRGHAEDRYLFAQLLSAAPRLTLSWLTADDDGAPLARSPLVERLLLERGDLAAPAAARHPHEDRPGAGDRPRPVHEAALLAGRAGGRRAFTALLPAALAEAGRPAPEALARARTAALAEIDAAPWEPAGHRLGPFLGLVGPLAEVGDLYVTRLEGLARCPWQAFLRKTLRLEPAPDPLAALSGLDPRLVGIAAHAVLEELVGRQLGEERNELAAALAAGPVAVAWPAPGDLDALVEAVCRRVARDEGVPLLGRALAARVRPFIETAGRQGLGAGFQAYGAELEGAVEVPAADGNPRRLAFRADLAAAAAGGLLLTDFKTGASVSDAKTESAQRRNFLEKIGQGKFLQAVAYAGAAVDRPATGRFLVLSRPDDAERVREFTVTPGDRDLRDRFAATAGVLLAAQDAGGCTPRLVDATLEKHGPACRFCEVVEACLQEDSGAVRRLARWIEAGRHGGGSPAGQGRGAAAALAVLRLHDKDERGG
jgi:RecB family exonuclease